MRRSAATLLLCTACSWPTALSDVPQWAHLYWGQAQEDLRVAGYPRASTIPAENFSFVPHEPTHIDQDAYEMEPGVWVYGHFSTGNWFRGPAIHYCTTVERVVRHEAGHAILWALKKPEHRCWQHECWEE